jgi:hypothetical protein
MSRVLSHEPYAGGTACATIANQQRIAQVGQAVSLAGAFFRSLFRLAASASAWRLLQGAEAK